VLISPEPHLDVLAIKHAITYGRIAEALQARFIHKLKSEAASNELWTDPTSEMVSRILYVKEQLNESEAEDASSELDGALWFGSLLSRIDGHVLVDGNWNVRGFGTVVTVQEKPALVYRGESEYFSPSGHSKLDITRYGTRHQSMAGYCALDEKAVGFVVSQDGDVRAMTSIDGALVIWEDIKLHFEAKPERRLRPILEERGL
jgi:hypothetical protein